MHHAGSLVLVLLACAVAQAEQVQGTISHRADTTFLTTAAGERLELRGELAGELERFQALPGRHTYVVTLEGRREGDRLALEQIVNPVFREATVQVLGATGRQVRAGERELTSDGPGAAMLRSGELRDAHVRVQGWFFADSQRVFISAIRGTATESARIRRLLHPLGGSLPAGKVEAGDRLWLSGSNGDAYWVQGRRGCLVPRRALQLAEAPETPQQGLTDVLR